MVPPHKAIVCHPVLPRAQLFPAFTPGTLMQLWNTDLRRRWSAHVFQQLVAMGAARHLPGLSRGRRPCWDELKPALAVPARRGCGAVH